MPDQDVFGFQIAMDDLLLLQQIQRAKHLLGEAPNHLQGETPKGVGLDELVEIHVQQFGRDAEMFPEVKAMCEIHHAVPIFRVLKRRLVDVIQVHSRRNPYPFTELL